MKTKAFRNNELDLSKEVFTPQWDTEGLIDLVIKHIDFGIGLEIGTGTGAIPIAIASESNNVIYSIDINKKAIELARKNAIKNNVEQAIYFETASIFESKFDTKFDFIVSNPPYISYDDEDVEEWVKQNQPEEGLYARDNGLEFYIHIINRFDELLHPNGMMFFEIGEEQENDLKKLVEGKFQYKFFKDLASKTRYMIIENNIPNSTKN